MDYSTSALPSLYCTEIRAFYITMRASTAQQASTDAVDRTANVPAPLPEAGANARPASSEGPSNAEEAMGATAIGVVSTGETMTEATGATAATGAVAGAIV